MTDIQVAVLMGGPSAEREVSLTSGRTAARALRNAGFAVSEVVVQGEEFALPHDADVAFIAMHGKFGEDGTLQQLLEDRGVAYTGCGPEASALAMDKTLAKARFVEAGVPTPAWVAVERDLRQAAGQPFPAVVKPARDGSSVGISIVHNAAELEAACVQAWHYDERLVIEQYIAGREFTVGILGERVLPVIEIRTRRQFFDFLAKYTPGEAEELVPAPLEAVAAARVQALAWRAHAALGCRDLSRVDLMMDGSGELLVLEVNTIPGLTPVSLLPKAAAAAGLSMEGLCGQLVEMALARRAELVVL